MSWLIKLGATHLTAAGARLPTSRPANMNAIGDTTIEKLKATGQAITSELTQASTIAVVKPR